jgi:hypothetical protein
VGNLRRRDLTGTGTTFFAKPFLAAVIEEAGAQACRLSAGRANKSQLGQFDRHLLAEPASLRILLAAPHVFINAIHAFHERLPALAIHENDAALHAAIGAGANFHGVSGTN